MSREELEKLSKDELLEIILAMQAKLLTFASRVDELEARLNINSTNSSVPPSCDKWKRPHSKRRKSGKKPGGQVGHQGHGLKIECEPDEIILHTPTVCEHCGLALSEVEGTVCESRYKIDIAIRKTTARHEQVKVVCPACEALNVGRFPDSLKSRTQYGEGVQAISLLFTNYAMVGYDKTQKILNDVFGVSIRSGTIVNNVKRFAAKSMPVLEEIIAKLKQSSVLNCDETGVRVNGKNQWLHTASNSEATYSTVHPNRGVAGIDDNGVLQAFSGTVVHDCWKPYFKYENCTHALCNAHLLRELQGVIDNTGQVWASRMQDLLRTMKQVVDEYKDHGKKELSSYDHKKFAETYEHIVRLGEQENPLVAGQKKRGKARCLLDRFITYKTEICRFTDDFEVPFDNNQAERDIRISKVKQKVSGGFRSDEGAKNFGKVSSVVGTAIKQGMSAFGIVSGIIAGNVSSLFQKDLVTE